MSITLTGLAINDPVPGWYFETSFAQGDPALGSATYAVILVGNKTSGGTATTNTVVYGPTNGLDGEGGAITLFGVGSELHRMVKFFLKVNTTTLIYAIAVTASGGTAASRAHVINGTASGSGRIQWTVCGEVVETSVSSGDIAKTMVDNSVADINREALANGWPVLATNATDTDVVLTARIPGPRGNGIRSAANITAGITTTVSNGAFGFLASGATADSNSTALGTLLPFRYYYIVSAANDATQFGAVMTQINTQSLPVNGIRQRGIGASNDTLGAVTTIVTGINAARGGYVHLAQCDWEPCALAAYYAGIISLMEQGLPWRTNLTNFGATPSTVELWNVPAPGSGVAPTRPNIVSALNNGISPIGVSAGGKTYLVAPITMRSLSGSTADYRIRPWHKVTVVDRYADDLQAKIAAQNDGKVIGDDPPAGGTYQNPNVATRKTVGAGVNKLTRDYGALSLLKNVDQIVAATIVERSTATRISVAVPLQTIDNFEQGCFLLLQVA